VGEQQDGECGRRYVEHLHGGTISTVLG
jgi:hypothetical protein